MVLREEKYRRNILQNNIKNLLDLLEQAQNKKDYETVAGYYMELGRAYKKEGNIPKLLYYLNRFDNLTGGDDNLYQKFKRDDMTYWLVDLETEYIPYERKIQQQVLEKSKDLNVLQKIQWVLLTMSRFCELFRRISVLPGFGGFEKLGRIINYFSEGIYGGLDKDKKDEIEDEIYGYNDLTDDIFDSSVMCDYTNKVKIPGQEDFVPADLEGGDNGGIGTDFFSSAYYDIKSFVYGKMPEDSRITMEFVPCGIMQDYYYRTSDSDIADEKKVKEEVNRIFSDYEFIKEEPDKEKFAGRIEGYKKIMLI